MRTGWLLLIGLVAGLCAGWLLGDDGDHAELQAPGTAPAGAGAERGRGVPGALSGRPDARHRAAEALRDLEAQGFGKGRRSRRGLEALAMLYALAGIEEDFLRVAGRAVVEGADPDDLLRALYEFPTARRGALLSALLSSHPEADFDSYEVARIFEKSGDPARALAVVREALPQVETFDADLARLLLKLDPTGGPGLMFGLGASPQWDSEALHSLHALLLEAGDESRLLPFLQRTLGERPDDHAALRLLAQLDGDAAMEHVRVRLSEDPGDAWSWSFLGTLHAKQGAAGAAFDAFREAAQRRPSTRYYEALMDLDPARALPLIVEWTKGASDDEAIGALAKAHLRAGDKDKALEIFLRAHEHDPDDSEWIEGLIELDPESAVQTLGKRVAPAPTAAKAELLGQYADALRAAGREAEAFDQYLLAHKKDPGGHEWQRSLAEADPRRALAVLDAHVQAVPGDASGHGAYGMALAAVGRKQEAIERLEHAMAEGNAAMWFDELEKLDERRALEGLRGRARRDSRNEDVWGTLGYVLERRGRTSEARDAFLRAMRLDPSNTEWAEALRSLK